MKTTLEIPDALLKQVKLQALHDGRKLKDEIAELLRKGLAVKDRENDLSPPVISKDKKTGLPVIECKRTPPAHEELTAARVAEILLDQEVEWHHVVLLSKS